MELALYSFLSDNKARQCRADIGLARRIGTGAAHVKAAQADANDNTRSSSSAFISASAPRLIRPIARNANNSAA